MNRAESYHLEFYPKLALWFAFFYGIAPLSQIKADPSGFQLWSFPLVALVAVLGALVSKWLAKHGREAIGRQVIKWVVLSVTFWVPLHILILLIMTRAHDPSASLQHHVYAYYISISVCSIVLYTNAQTALFYVKNVLISLLIPLGLLGLPFYQVPLSQWILHPALVFGIGGIQMVILNLFKIRILKELEEGQHRARIAETRNRDLLNQYEGISAKGFDGVVVMNDRLEVTYLNDRALPNEYARNQILGRRISYLCDKWGYDEADSLQVLKDITGALTRKKTVFTSIHDPSGSLFLLFYTPLLDGQEVTGIVLNLRKFH